MSEQRDQRTVDLNEVTGCGLADSEERLQDDDLWLLEPERRWAFSTMEDAVEQWQDVANFLDGLDDTVYGVSPAYTQMLWDAQLRASEALRRVRERAGETAGG